MDSSTPRPVEPVLLLAALVILTHWYAARVAWHTEGEIVSGLHYLLLWSQVVLAVLALWRRRLVWLLLVPWLLVVPRQALKADELRRAEREATRIVSWAYERRHLSGDFPPTLDGYVFTDETIRGGIFDYGVTEDGCSFGVTYGAFGTENSAHWFDSVTGWGYYPD
ncbi:MAG: hypothetical protein AAGC60_03780 [Acidobacteriota bacterium]